MHRCPAGITLLLAVAALMLAGCGSNGGYSTGQPGGTWISSVSFLPGGLMYIDETAHFEVVVNEPDMSNLAAVYIELGTPDQPAYWSEYGESHGVIIVISLKRSDSWPYEFGGDSTWSGSWNCSGDIAPLYGVPVIARVKWHDGSPDMVQSGGTLTVLPREEGY